MIVFLNGQFVAEERAAISVFDRGFLYGDGLFETLTVARGRPLFWKDHLDRLQRGAAFLHLTMPFPPDGLLDFALRLIARNPMPGCLLRLTLSRGSAGPGYSPKNANWPTCVMSLHPAPEAGGSRPARWRVVTSSFRVRAGDPLTRFKTANKLPQVLARSQADAAGAHEALLLNTAGHLAEGTASNVFWVRDNVICTPPLRSGALPGVTRRVILDLCAKRNVPCREKQAGPAALRGADGVFLTLTSMGVVEVESLDGRRLKRSPLVKQLWAEYQALL